MKRYFPICLFLVSAWAHASCEKIEYVEVKDWPVAKVEQAYCGAFSEKWRIPYPPLDQQELPNGEPTPRYKNYKEELNVCFAQIALYKRVLENVHKRRVPFCGPMPGP